MCQLGVPDVGKLSRSMLLAQRAAIINHSSLPGCSRGFEGLEENLDSFFNDSWFTVNNR